MTREENERALYSAEAMLRIARKGGPASTTEEGREFLLSEIERLADMLRASLEREAKLLGHGRLFDIAKARDLALEEAARECEAADCAAPSAAWHGAQVACARRVRALKSPGAR